MCSGETLASFHLLGNVHLFMLWLQMYVMSSAIYGAASLSSQGPILSVPVALLESIVERCFKTLSLSILLILNLVFSGSFELQKSLNLS